MGGVVCAWLLQVPERLHPFSSDIATLMGASALTISAEPPADAGKYTVAVVDDVTTVYMLLAVRQLPSCRYVPCPLPLRGCFP